MEEFNYDHQTWLLKQRQQELEGRLRFTVYDPNDTLPIRPASQWRQSDEPLVSKDVAGYLAEWFAQ